MSIAGTSGTQIDVTLINLTKYGDADLASKKRKDDDEYNTIFTKRLNEPNLNSTEIGSDETDFNGGLLSTTTTTPPPFCDDDWEPIDLISQNPSSSSFGFENTFKVLEGQLCGTQKLNRKQVEHLLRNSDLRKNPIFLDVPFASKDRFLRAISEEKCIPDDEQNNSYQADEPPSFLELELDARQRIKELSSINDTRKNVKYVEAEQLTEAEQATSSMNEFLYGICGGTSTSSTDSSTKFESVVSEDIQQLTGEYPEYVYHMAKGKDGRVYLRVVRSLLVDKGN